MENRKLGVGYSHGMGFLYRDFTVVSSGLRVYGLGFRLVCFGFGVFVLNDMA